MKTVNFCSHYFQIKDRNLGMGVNKRILGFVLNNLMKIGQLCYRQTDMQAVEVSLLKLNQDLAL